MSDSNGGDMRHPNGGSQGQLGAFLRGVRSRRPASLELLYDATAARVYALAVGVLGDVAAADRVVADTYVEVWRGVRIDTRTAEGFEGRLLLLCRELALESMRKGKGAPRAPEVDLVSSIASGSALHADLARLDELPRRLLSLALFRGLTFAQISAHTGVPLAEVRSALAAAVRALDESTHVADLESILFTGELNVRAARCPDFAAESRALRAFADELAKPCGSILSTLVESALTLCHAQTAGISIVESGEEGVVFRWHAVTGALGAHQGGFLPRHASPCGVVIDTDAAQLMIRPDRHFPAVRAVSPRIVEVLLVPFRMLGQPVGTIWVVAHDDDTHFDAEDCRVMGSLAAFASAAYVLRSSQQAALEARDELSRANERLRRSNDRMWGKLVDSKVVDPSHELL